MSFTPRIRAPFLAALVAVVPGEMIAQRTVVQRVHLEPCALASSPDMARCGVHRVFEDRTVVTGRTIPMFVAVLPATEAPAAPDPLFILAGGPGQAASQLANFANQSFAAVRRHRDIVLVDPAGTFRSAGLRCRMYRTAKEVAGDFYPIANVRSCRDSLSRTSDLRRYTTAVLTDDLDEVRAALGYDRINIYGTSYGTRAALVYVRRHGDHVRAIVLKAVAPPTMPGTMSYARDTERSLKTLFAACSAQTACSTAFPGVQKALHEALKRAEDGTLTGVVPDPDGGPSESLPLSRGVVASTLLGLLQNSNSAVGLPHLIHTTYQGDTRPLVQALVRYRLGLDASIAFGMHLSVMCSEDAPRMSRRAAALADRGTALGDYRVVQLAAACREWIGGSVPAGYATGVHSKVPPCSSPAPSTPTQVSGGAVRQRACFPTLRT